MQVELERQHDICVVRIKGDIVPGLGSEYLRFKQDLLKLRDCGKVLFDFRDVPSLGSTGISFVVSIFKTCGGRFVLACPRRNVREVLDLTHLSQVVPIAPDVASGLAALRRVP